MSIIKNMTTRRRLLRLAAAAVLGGTAGCGNVDTRPATWDYISSAIFQPSCATGSCHGPASAVAGLDFSTPEHGYTSLTGLWVWIAVPPDAGAPPAGVPCATVDNTLVCERQLRPLVTPFDPGGARVVNTLRARNAPRMPPDRPLTEADIRLVETWILNGACRTGTSCSGPRDGGADGAAEVGAAPVSGVPASDAGGVDTGVDQGAGG
jgi:hypothetical protein